MVRIFTACHGTQLLVIQHLRRHLQLPSAREFLIWHPLDKMTSIEAFVQSVLSTAGFADTLDIRDFESLKPRSQGHLTWWLESVRRLATDAATVRRWMENNGIVEHDAELWADDPIHFNVTFPSGLLRKARHVKIPHCFNHEDATVPESKERSEKQWRLTSWPKRLFFLPWQRWMSGVDLRMERVVYDRAYTFDQPSSWAGKSMDVSHLISLKAFEETFQTLPASARADVEKILGPIRAGRRPLVILLLFGLGSGPALRHLYETSVSRIFSEHSSELNGCSLAVKVHPAANGAGEQVFIDWLKVNIPAQIYPIFHPLNLEFMLPWLKPDYVLAGVCGALPIIRRLKLARPVALSELTDAYLREHPNERQAIGKFLHGIELW
jgi:hypothetical protein